MNVYTDFGLFELEDRMGWFYKTHSVSY